MFHIRIRGARIPLGLTQRAYLHFAGDFPTYYTHEPSLVISNRSRTRDRFLSQPQYQLMNQHYDRTRELTSFNMVSLLGCNHQHYKYYSIYVYGCNISNYFRPGSTKHIDRMVTHYNVNGTKIIWSQKFKGNQRFVIVQGYNNI